MSIKATITLKSGTAYYLSDETIEGADERTYYGRILNKLAIENAVKPFASSLNNLRTLNLSIRNDDNYLSGELWSASVAITIEGVNETWKGLINSWSQDGAGTLNLSLFENSIVAFQALLPDEMVRISSFPDASMAASNITIPTVFGGKESDPVRVPGILVHRTKFRYLLCVGEIRSIVRVFKDRTEITDGFTTALGTKSQLNLPGYAYIEFEKDPRDGNGRWPEILVDVIGLKLGNYDETECRNPARILQYLLTTENKGACAWGLGISADDLNLTSITNAISDCETFGFYLDGALMSQRQASLWIAEICKSGRMSLYKHDGLWCLDVDKANSSVCEFTDDDIELLHFGKASVSDVVNDVTLQYRYDATEGTFLGSQQRTNDTNIALIGRNRNVEELYLVKDHYTAGKLADYRLGLAQYSSLKVEFKTRKYSISGTNLRKHDVISIKTRNVTGSFRILKIDIDDFLATVEATEYSDDIFATSDTTLTTDPELDPVLPGVLAADAIPENVQNFRGWQDGEFIDLIWDTSNQASLVKYEIRKGQSWGTSQIIIKDFHGSAWTFKANETGLYNIMIKAVLPTNVYSETPSVVQINIQNIFSKNILISRDEMSLQDGTHNNTAFLATGKWANYSEIKFSEMGDTKWSDIATLKLELTGVSNE